MPDAPPIRVYLLDDHEVVRRGLAELLTDAGIEVVGDSGVPGRAVVEIGRLRPDVAVLDVRMGTGPDAPTSGIEVCRRVRSDHPQLAVLMLTAYADDAALFGAIMAGAAGFVLKELRGSDLVAAVRQVAAGRSLLDPAVTAAVLQRLRSDEQLPGVAELTARERSVLELIADGLTNRQIAQRLFLAEKTVKNHVTAILTKLGLRSRTQAALLAARLNTRLVARPDRR